MSGIFFVLSSLQSMYPWYSWEIFISLARSNITWRVSATHTMTLSMKWLHISEMLIYLCVIWNLHSSTKMYIPTCSKVKRQFYSVLTRMLHQRWGMRDEFTINPSPDDAYRKIFKGPVFTWRKDPITLSCHCFQGKRGANQTTPTKYKERGLLYGELTEGGGWGGGRNIRILQNLIHLIPIWPTTLVRDWARSWSRGYSGNILESKLL